MKRHTGRNTQCNSDCLLSDVLEVGCDVEDLLLLLLLLQALHRLKGLGAPE
jgi:hypothetical protein